MQDSLLTATTDVIYTTLSTRADGLRDSEVLANQAHYGLNTIASSRSSIVSMLIRQVTSNVLIIVLSIATCISYLLGEHTSSYYIFTMILVSIGLGFWNEYAAERTVEGLLKTIAPTVSVMRNAVRATIPASQLTIGDIVLISPGTIIPADMRIVDARNLSIDQSALTGESMPVDKTAAPLSSIPHNKVESANIAFMGTTVVGGTARGVVVDIGVHTSFGVIAESTTYIKPQTDFEKGLASFGSLLVKTILILTLAMFGVNAVLGHPILESLLFALAIAVGLTPELLPVIVTVSLSRGAGVLARHHVVAKQLIAIENLGNMDILCTDKTGTLTEGIVEVVDVIPLGTNTMIDVLRAALIATNQNETRSGIDAAIERKAQKEQVEDTTQHIVDEPFDFERKAIWSVVEQNNARTLIVKGAPDWLLSHAGAIDPSLNQAIHERYTRGERISLIAQKSVSRQETYTWNDVTDLTISGYVTFRDTPKTSAKEALQHLHHLNVAVKIITGDNELVAQSICRDVGMDATRYMLGSDVDTLSTEALRDALMASTIIARTTPDQKLKVIQTLRAMGHTVGYMGDGINDIPSLRAADVGISVNTAVDVAKSAASIVLLSKGLDVIAAGIREGRRTFNNTIKYILMSTSSNFGNMFSAAGASFILPAITHNPFFLPMTPVQILLTNALYDLSQLGIPSDNVDKESLIKPRHWNISFIRSYMIFFGPVSSIYDFLTFGALLFMFHAYAMPLFQTGWFIESIMTEILVVFVIRTSRTPFYKSKPSKTLFLSCMCLIAVALAIPFSPFARSLGLVAPSCSLLITLFGLVVTYLILVEFMKQKFLKRYSL